MAMLPRLNGMLLSGGQAGPSAIELFHDVRPKLKP
jgi:hypothetical protein